MDFDRVLRFALDHGASDIHLQADAPPMLRLGGHIRVIEGEQVTEEAMQSFLQHIVPRHLAEDLAGAAVRGLDFSHALPSGERFRCSAFRTLGRFGMTMRAIRTDIPSIEALNLPQVIHDIALARRGLTLVTGTTGSGKSTTLASMIDLINTRYRTKIITVEDPVEYLHANKKALVSQIEVGADTSSFDQALRQALRQDPDVILVGELRDVETLKIALRAADTGHQVFSTLHSSNAAQTIERIIAMFPADEHSILLSQLATNVEAIISQRLVTTTAGGRRPAVEVLRGSAVTEKFIFERRLGELLTYIETGESGMQSFDQHLLKMYQEKAISGTEAMRWATNPEMMGMALRGIRRIGSGGEVVMLEKA